jgi:hypothetical protein
MDAIDLRSTLKTALIGFCLGLLVTTTVAFFGGASSANSAALAK